MMLVVAWYMVPKAGVLCCAFGRYSVCVSCQVCMVTDVQYMYLWL